MPQHFNHPVSVWVLFLSFTGLIILAGCSSDEEPVTEVKPDAAPPGPTYDMGPSVALPTPVTDIFRYLPEAPEGIRSRPGDAAAPLIQVKEVTRVAVRDKKFKRTYSETPASGPFKKVQYIMSQDGKSVHRVIGTFHRQYARKDRHESIIEMIKMRLGAPKEIKTKKTISQRWALPEFGIEVRKDLVAEKYFSSAPLELIYDTDTRSVPAK